MPFRGWEPFEGPDSRDLAAAGLPVPEGMARAMVRLRDPRRWSVPVTVVCPEFGPDDARGWVAGGQVPDLAGAVLDAITKEG
jgi:hypothetical protein